MKRYIIIPILLLTLVSCEKVIPFDTSISQSELVLNAVPSAEKRLFVYFAHTLFFLDSTNNQPISDVDMVVSINGVDYRPTSVDRCKYFFDYYRTVCGRFDVPRYYCVDFDPERFHELEEVLDRRYAEFNNRGPAEDDLEEDGRKLRTHYFDTEAELFHEPGTPPEYVNLCADAYKTMGGRLSRAISGELLEYCTEDLPGEDVPPEKILPHFHPKRVVVMKPVSLRTPGAHDHGPETEEPVSAYVILGESDWEQEHGIAFTVIGDCVVNSSFYADALSPWTEDMMWEYRRQRDAELGNFCEAEAVPAQFGGAGNDRIRMLAASARRKEEIDEMIEALFVLKMAEKYDYKIVYRKMKKQRRTCLKKQRRRLLPHHQKRFLCPMRRRNFRMKMRFLQKIPPKPARTLLPQNTLTLLRTWFSKKTLSLPRAQLLQKTLPLLMIQIQFPQKMYHLRRIIRSFMSRRKKRHVKLKEISSIGSAATAENCTATPQLQRRSNRKTL